MKQNKKWLALLITISMVLSLVPATVMADVGAAVADAPAAIVSLAKADPEEHPSGDPAPSREDIQLTKQMMKAGEIMGIPVLDHVVVAGDNFLSLKEANCL